MRLMTVNFHLNVLNVEYLQTGSISAPGLDTTQMASERIKNDADFNQEELFFPTKWI